MISWRDAHHPRSNSDSRQAINALNSICGKKLIQASSGLDYSRGAKRIAPGVSKLGRTPTRGGKKPPQHEAQQGRATFFGWQMFESEPAAPAEKDPDGKFLDCPYEEHCEYDQW